MINMKIDMKEFNKVFNNVIEFTQGFVEEIDNKQSYISRKVANTSVLEFYRYLDSLARTNPSMLHHIYEWGAVGNPSERLYELQTSISGNATVVSSNFLQSSSIRTGSKEPFYDKANIMENGITVVINQVNAEALFFEIDGEEYFRLGPIIVENPGGLQTRGAFVQNFEEFYGKYFTQVYLRAIRFYEHFSEAKEYYSSFSGATKSSGARSIGKSAAMSLIMNAPGDDYE